MKRLATIFSIAALALGVTACDQEDMDKRYSGLPSLINKAKAAKQSNGEGEDPFGNTQESPEDEEAEIDSLKD